MMTAIVFKDGIRMRKFQITPKKNGNGNNNGKKKSEKEKTSVPSSGKYCSFCNEMVANGDPYGEDVPGSDGKKRRHTYCAEILAVVRGKNTELREAANL